MVVHHDNGTSFGADFFFDPLYDQLLFLFGWLHNDLLGLELATCGHYAFVAAFDCGITAMNAAIIYAHVAILFGVLNPPSSEERAKAEGAEAKKAKKVK